MLLPMKEILNRAEVENYAVAAPNVFTSLEVRAALDTAQALQTPIILDIAYESVADFRTLGVFAVQLAKEACIPVAVNLDHGHYSKEHPNEIEDAIAAGFSAVMVDASDRPYDENVAITSRLSLFRMKIPSRELPTIFSEGVYPGRSAFVDSHMSRVTPSVPISPSRARSMTSPSIGVRSSLKSPE